VKNNSYTKEFTISLLKSKDYYTVYLLIIISLLYALIFDNSNSLVGSGIFFWNLDILMSPCTLFILFSICFSTILIIKKYNESTFALIRYKSKEEYVKKLLLIVIGVNTVILLLIFSSLLLISIFKNFSSVTNNSKFFYYDISYGTYYVFYIIKIFILIQLLSVISVLLSQIFNKNIIIILYFLVSLSYFTGEYKEVGIISSFSNFRFLFFDYFNMYQYASFFHEILYTSIYIMCLLIVTNILYEILKRKAIEVKA